MSAKVISTEGLIMCTALLGLLFVLNRKRQETVAAGRYLNALYFVVIGNVILDTVWLHLEGNPELIFWHKLVQVVYLSSAPFLSFLWLQYVGQHFGIKCLQSKKSHILCVTPYIASAILTIVSWEYGFIFQINAEGSYVRGPLVLFPFLLMYGGFLIAGVLLFMHAKHHPEQKRTAVGCALFPIFIFVLGIGEILIPPGMPIIYIGFIACLFCQYEMMLPVEEGKLTSAAQIMQRNERNANRMLVYVVLFCYLALILDYMVLLVPSYGEETVAYGSYATLVLGFLLMLCLYQTSEGVGEKHFGLRKYLLIGTFAMVAGSFSLLYVPTTYFVAPITLALAGRYYDRKLMRWVCIVTPIIMGVLITIGFFFFDAYDVNILMLPEGTVLTIPEGSNWLEDAIPHLANGTVSAVAYLLFYYVPFLGVYLIAVFIFNGISRNGYKVLVESVQAEKEKAVMEETIQIAASIQESMLPVNFDAYGQEAEAKVFATMTPALEVGGDFYDFFAVDEAHVCFLIGDVSGKGVPAALFMAKAQTCIDILAKMHLTPGEILERANTMLAERNSEMCFVTVWLGILNVETGELQYAIAGHNPALLLMKAQGTTFEYLDEAHGEERTDVALGAMPELPYLTRTRCLQPGDRILLYTDGVTEAQNPESELYGEDRLRSYVNLHLDQPTEEMIRQLQGELKLFADKREQFDDITMISVDFVAYKES